MNSNSADIQNPDQDERTYTIADAGQSSWAPTSILLATRLSSALFLIFVIVRFSRVFDTAALLLPVWSSALLVLSFTLLSVCSALDVFSKSCTFLPKIAALIHQSGASLAVTNLMLLPLMGKRSRTRLYVIGSMPAAAVFLFDSVFLATTLQFQMSYIVVPCLLAIANYMIRTIVTNTRSKEIEKTSRQAMVDMSMKVIAVSIAAGVITNAISSLGKAIQKCRRFDMSRRRRRSVHV